MNHVTPTTQVNSLPELSVTLPATDNFVVPKSPWASKYSELMKTARIAIVDDEQLNIDVVQGHLEQEGYRNFFRTTDSTKAIDLFSKFEPDVVLLDVMMPEVSGLDILAEMRVSDHLSHIPVVILTASTGSDVKLRALELGISDFLAKPVDASELLLRLKNVLAVKAYQDHLENHSHELEMQVRKRTRELRESRQHIIHCLARAAEFRDDDTGHHVIRVGRYAAIIARELGFTNEQVELIEHAAQLHDIGKIGVPDSVLLKEGKLDPDEFTVIQRHCSIGKSIINPMSLPEFSTYQSHTDLGAQLLTIKGNPVMELAAIIAQTHHEKWDGSGYPLGLTGEDIPIEGRITAVADVYDALSTKRPYKPAFSREKCFNILEEGRGKHFDPNVLDAFFNCSDQIVNVQILFADVEKR